MKRGGPIKTRTKAERDAKRANREYVLAIEPEPKEVVYRGLQKVGKRGKQFAAGDGKARKALNDKTGGICERCGRPGAHQCHVLPKSHYPEFRDDPRNHWKGCVQCHIEEGHAEIIEAWKWFAAYRPEDAAHLNLEAHIALAESRLLPVRRVA